MTAFAERERNWAKYVNDIAKTGLTQRQIAQLIGCSQPSIANISNGRNKASFRVGMGLIKLGASKGLGTPEFLEEPIAHHPV